MNRVALYARVSSEIQEKEATIESQVAQLREAAQKQGDVIIQEYRDDGFSGDLLARPGLDRLRDDATKKLFERVLILSPDRLARKYIWGQVVADELKKQGIAVQFLNQKDDGTEESRLLLGITGLFAEYEKAKIIERCRRGKLFSARSGRLVTNRAPYGYTFIARSTEGPARFEIDEKQSEVVRLIFGLYGRGEKATDICRYLRSHGILAPRGNAVWGRSTIMKMLPNTSYIGIWHYNKTIAAAPFKLRKPNAVRRRLNTTEHRRPRDQWVAVKIPPILNQDTFDAVQRQLERNRQFSKRNCKRQYLLSGLCRCANCGKAVGGSPNNGYQYYRCSSNFGFGGMPPSCSQKGLPSPRVDRVVWSAIRQALENPQILVQNITGVQEALSKNSQSFHREQEDMARELAKVKEAETRLLDAYSAKAIEVDQLQEHMQKLREKRDDLVAKLATPVPQETSRAVEFSTVEQVCRKVSRGLDILEGDFEGRQKFVRSIIDKVVLGPAQATIIGALPEAASEPLEPSRSLGVGTLPARTRRTGWCPRRPRRRSRGRGGGVP